jgi:myo-inositol-1(or 4)-monophosphatase
MSADIVLEVLHEAADAVVGALGMVTDWGPSGQRATQYQSDLAADEAALGVLARAGFGVVSEESGVTRPDAPVWVALDPLDGSTNAHRGIPWYATSLCAVDGDGPLAAVVHNLVSGARYTAVRGSGAWRDGVAIAASGCDVLGEAVVTLSGWPSEHLGWGQFRTLGAAALDLCAVADGTLDGFVDCSRDAHGVWDYLGGLLVCREAGGVVHEAEGRSLVVRAHDARRTPVAGATCAVADALLAARQRLDRAHR